MSSRFKKGDKVRIVNCTQDDLNSYGSTGVLGEVYEVAKVTLSSSDVAFVGGNWHKEIWLVKVLEIRRGGE